MVELNSFIYKDRIGKVIVVNVLLNSRNINLKIKEDYIRLAMEFLTGNLKFALMGWDLKNIEYIYSHGYKANSDSFSAQLNLFLESNNKTNTNLSNLENRKTQIVFNFNGVDLSISSNSIQYIYNCNYCSSDLDFPKEAYELNDILITSVYLVSDDFKYDSNCKIVPHNVIPKSYINIIPILYKTIVDQLIFDEAILIPRNDHSYINLSPKEDLKLKIQNKDYMNSDNYGFKVKSIGIVKGEI
jgi:hypothetical protein